MFKSYISVALRNLIKNRLYNVINVGGLSVGLAACIMILLFVDHELSYDQWIPQNERVYRAEAITRFEGAPEGTTASIPPVIGPIMSEQLNEIEDSVRFVWQPVAIAADNKAFELSVTLTDAAIFEVFGITLIEGSIETALNDPDAIILTESEALRILGPGSALGKVVRVNGEFTFKVTGVMADWPTLSDLSVEALVPYSTPIIDNQPWLRENWGSFSGNTYVRAKEGVSLEGMADALNALAMRVGPDWAYQSRIDRGLQPAMEFYFTPSIDAHLKSQFNNGSRGSIEALWSAGLVAVLILSIAVMNATNLGTMLALKRVREVAIRKALGANSRNLVFQILIESIILAAIAMLLGIVLVELLLPTFGDLMERSLATAPLYQPLVLLPLTFFTLVVGTLSGLYPALVAAKFRPIDHLSGIAPTVGVRFRNALMITQFAATIGLLITCFVVFQQAKYAETRDPGFESAQLVDLAGIDRPIVLEREKALRDALSRVPGVEAVTASHIAPGDNYNNFDRANVDNGPAVSVRRVAVSEEFFETMDIAPLAGRVFSPGRLSDRAVYLDNSLQASVILNRQAVTELGIDTIQEAVGRTLIMDGDALPIIGVVEDLRMDSVSRQLRPSFFYVDPQQFRHIILRVSGYELPTTLSAIDSVWREQFPDIPVQRQFMDEAFADYYAAARRRGQLLLGSALVMIVIASTGLFALSALTTERRAQEIGIRKVLGAGTRNIVNLLLWQFSKPIIIANLIAWPVVWFLMQDWLQSFTDRITLSPIPFIGAGVLVLMIAGVTIVGQVIFLAMTNPAKILRYE